MERFIGRDTENVELIFNLFTSGIETFVIPWDQRMYRCVVEVCRLDWNQSVLEHRAHHFPRRHNLLECR